MRTSDTVDGAQASSTIAPDRPAGPAGRAIAVPTAIALIGVLVGLLLGRGLLLEPTIAGSTAAAPAPAPADLDDRIAALEDHTTATPDDAAAWQRLGVAYVERGEQTGDPSFHRLAGDALDRAQQLRPDDPATTAARGVLALALHDFEHALMLGNEVLADNDRAVTALGVVTDAQVELGRYEDAAATAQRMLDVRPSLPALSRVSYLRELAGHVDGAVLAMEQAAAAGQGLSAELARVEALLGDLHVHHRGHTQARAAYERALARDDDLPRARTGLARLSAIEGDLAGAIEQLSTLTADTPFPDALLLLSDLQAAVDDDAVADTDAVLRATVALQRDADQSVDLELALFEADTGNGAAAVSLARRAYRARPTIHAAAALAWAHHVDGEASRGVPLVDEALSLGTRDATLRYRMAAVLAGAGQGRRAAEQLATAFDIDPWFSWRHRDDARRLANTLGVAVPDEWGTS